MANAVYVENTIGEYLCLILTIERKADYNVLEWW